MEFRLEGYCYCYIIFFIYIGNCSTCRCKYLSNTTVNKRLLCTDFCGCGPTWENADSDLILENANFPGKDDEGVKLPENNKRHIRTYDM